MILGSVNTALEPGVNLKVLDALGQEQPIEAIIDTGFSGSLTLPPSLLTAIGSPWYTQGEVKLGNGAVERVDIYAVTLIWDGVARYIFAHAVDSAPLVGTKLLHGYDLRVRFEDGGLVEIEEIQ